MPRNTTAPAPEAAPSTPQDEQPARRYGPSLNRVQLVGRLAAQPELRFTPNGKAVTTLRLATNDRSGAADFHDVIAWGQDAEFAAQYLAKGRLVFVQGRLHSRSWTAQDGTPRRTVEVVAEELQALTPPPPAAGASVETPSDEG